MGFTERYGEAAMNQCIRDSRFEAEVSPIMASNVQIQNRPIDWRQHCLSILIILIRGGGTSWSGTFSFLFAKMVTEVCRWLSCVGLLVQYPVQCSMFSLRWWDLGGIPQTTFVIRAKQCRIRRYCNESRGSIGCPSRLTKGLRPAMPTISRIRQKSCSLIWPIYTWNKPLTTQTQRYWNSRCGCEIDAE